MNTRSALAAVVAAAVLLLTSCGSTATDPSVPAHQDDRPTTSQPKTEEPAPEPAMTSGQEQALGAAQDYLAMGAFSRAGLVEQLSSNYGDGFAVKDATFAVNHLKVNWHEQAYKAAKDYLSMSHFSRAGLVQQLSSPYGDQFTQEQAVYAVNKVGLK